MKKILLILIFIFLSSNYANSFEFNLVCRLEKENGTLEKDKWFYELNKANLIIDNEKYKLSSSPVITETLISFETLKNERHYGANLSYSYIANTTREFKVNRRTGQMVEKLSFIDDKKQDQLWIYYYMCEIF